MILADARDDGEDGLDDIRAVEPSTHADLDDCEVDPLLTEVDEGHHGRQLEERR